MWQGDSAIQVYNVRQARTLSALQTFSHSKLIIACITTAASATAATHTHTLLIPAISRRLRNYTLMLQSWKLSVADMQRSPLLPGDTTASFPSVSCTPYISPTTYGVNRWRLPNAVEWTGPHSTQNTHHWYSQNTLVQTNSQTEKKIANNYRLKTNWTGSAYTLMQEPLLKSQAETQDANTSYGNWRHSRILVTSTVYRLYNSVCSNASLVFEWCGCVHCMLMLHYNSWQLIPKWYHRL